jgi:hypothetical protein
MAKRAKEAVILLRVTGRDKGLLVGMAEKAGLSLTDFMVSRAFGEVVEPREVEQVSVAPGQGLEDVRARFNMKPASALLDGGDATPPEAAKRKVMPRPYAWNRQGFYETLSKGDWWMIQRDLETGQVWVATTTRQAKEFKTVEEAKRFVDANEG